MDIQNGSELKNLKFLEHQIECLNTSLKEADHPNLSTYVVYNITETDVILEFKIEPGYSSLDDLIQSGKLVLQDLGNLIT